MKYKHLFVYNHRNSMKAINVLICLCGNNDVITFTESYQWRHLIPHDATEDNTVTY